MNDDLDKLLSAPLPDMPDDGFTRRVEQRIATDRTRAARLESIAIAATLALTFAMLPFTPAGASLGAMMENLGGALMQSQTVLIATAGLLLGYVALHFVRD